MSCLLYWLLTSLLKLCLAFLSLVLYKVLMKMEVFGFRLISLHFIVWKESLIVGVVYCAVSGDMTDMTICP